MAASVPVVIASDQSAVATTITATAAVVSTANSSTTPLGVGGVFTGTAELTDTYASISVFVFTNVASAANGLSIQFSQDATNWDFISTTTVAANSGIAVVLAPVGRYIRIVYTNGGSAQATFRLQTKFHSVALSPIALPLSTSLAADIPTIVTHGVIAGVTTGGGGGFIDVKVSPSGAIQIGGTIDTITTLPLPSGAATEATQAAQMSRTDTFKTRSDTFTTTTNGTIIDCSASPMSAYAIQVTATGAVTSWDVRLEASLNGTTFTTILTHTNVTGDGITLWTGTLEAPALYFRSRTAGLVLGGGTNVVVVILGQN
jgi:hypothetical protein